MKSVNQLKHDTRVFCATVLILIILGLLFIYSSSSVYALERFGSPFYFLKKQSYYLVPSCAGFLFFALVPIRVWRKLTPLLFCGALGVTLLTTFSSLTMRMHGANRWLSIAGMSFQPSEVLKLFLFMYLAIILQRKEQRLLPLLASYLPFMFLLGISSLVLLKQPDFGSVVLIFITSFLLFFVAHINVRHLFFVMCACVPVALGLVLTKAYRLHRILIFLNPWSDPLGRGFQIIQSLIAVGVGGLWGLGVGNSRQKFFYLPMQHTDFIFSIVAEEIGFIGSLLIVACFASFCFFGLRVVAQLSDEYAFFTSLSFILFISLQAVINIMVTLGLLPTKGLGLPFVSYGGSALLTFCCMIGFIVGAVRHERGW